MHPSLPESRAATAQLTEAAATVDRLEKREAAQQKEAKAAADRIAKQDEARKQIEKALADSDFKKAKRLISTNTRLLGDSEASALRKSVADKQFQPRDVSLKEIKNLGREFIGRRVRVRCKFHKLNQTWVTQLPGVRGVYASPEGLTYSFSGSAAKKWMGLFVGDEEIYLFQRVFAPKEKFRDRLMAMAEDTELTIVGRVIDFGTNNWVALIVEELEERK